MTKNLKKETICFVTFLFFKIIKITSYVFSYNVRNISGKFEQHCLKNEGGDRF